MLGNKSVLLALSSLTTGNLNSKLQKNSTPYRMEDILPMAHEYFRPVLTEQEKQEQVSKTLIGYLKRSPKVPLGMLNGNI